MRFTSDISLGNRTSKWCSTQYSRGASCSELSCAAVVRKSALGRVALRHISRGPLKLGENGAQVSLRAASSKRRSNQRCDFPVRYTRSRSDRIRWESYEIE